MRLSFEITDRAGHPIPRPKKGSGRLVWSNALTVKSGGSLDIIDDGRSWLTEELTITAFVNGQPLPLGVYRVTAPDVEYETGRNGQLRETLTLTLSDRLSLLNREVIASTFALPAGANGTAVVDDLLTGHPATINHSPETLRTAMFWEAGTTKLRVINDIFDAIGYFSLWADRTGYFRVEPYVRPQARPVAGRFPYGQIKRSKDIYNIVNRVVCISAADPDTGALVSVAENNDPASPYSIPNQGVVGHVEEGLDVASQAALDVYTARRLTDLSSAAAVHTVEHLIRPIDLNELYDVRGPAPATVQRIEIPLALAKCVTTLREVAA